MKMPAKMTIQEIAKESGVSVATVSRVLRKLPGVSPELTEKVRKAMTGNESFRPRLKLSKKLTRIALVAYKSEPSVDYFTAMALSGISKFAFDYAIDVSLLIRPPELIDVPGLVGMLREHAADAAIISYTPHEGTFLKDLEAYRSQLAIPMVMCYDSCDFMPHVVSDDRQGEVQLAQRLIDLGHRKIGYVGGTYGEDLQGPGLSRLNSFLETCRKAGVEISQEWIAVQKAKHLDLASHYRTVKELLTRNPDLTALYCYNDDIAFAAQRACQDLGLRVPEDISITGFDGAPHGAYGHCTLTTYKVEAEAMAYEASRLCYVMSKGVPQAPKASVVAGQFIAGESTCPPQNH